MNLYRVPYTYRPAIDAAPQEKVAFVVAESAELATAYINAKPGHQARRASAYVTDVQVADEPAVSG